MYHHVAVVCLLFPWLAAGDEQATDRLFTEAENQLLAGDYLPAREGFAKVWHAYEKTYGESDSRTIEARIYYGQVLTMTGDHTKAMSILGPISSGDTRNAMIARTSFALALRQAGQMDRSIKLLSELVKIFPPTSPPNMNHLARMHSELAVCLGYMKRFHSAEDHAVEALRLVDASGFIYVAHRASINTILGQIYMLAGRDKDAYQTLTKALEEARPYWRPGHPELAVLQGALGMLAFRAGRYDEAETHTRNAMESIVRLLGPDHSEVGMVSRQLSMILKKQKRNQESKEYEARARHILDRASVAPRVSAWSFREVR
jgi:tetratricopeptide (TPR) repeat protein